MIFPVTPLVTHLNRVVKTNYEKIAKFDNIYRTYMLSWIEDMRNFLSGHQKSRNSAEFYWVLRHGILLNTAEFWSIPYCVCNIRMKKKLHNFMSSEFLNSSGILLRMHLFACNAPCFYLCFLLNFYIDCGCTFAFLFPDSLEALCKVWLM